LGPDDFAVAGAFAFEAFGAAAFFGAAFFTEARAAFVADFFFAGRDGALVFFMRRTLYANVSDPATRGHGFGRVI
jgi:N-acetylneuraminic acid mutarotase